MNIIWAEERAFYVCTYDDCNEPSERLAGRTINSMLRSPKAWPNVALLNMDLARALSTLSTVKSRTAESVELESSYLLASATDNLRLIWTRLVLF